MMAADPTRTLPDDSDDDGARSLPDTALIKALRIAVIAMGVMLVVGFVTIITRIIYLAGKPVAPTGLSELKSDIRLALPAGAKARSASLSGNRLTVVTEAPGGDEIVIIDLESGMTLSRVRLTSDGTSR